MRSLVPASVLRAPRSLPQILRDHERLIIVEALVRCVGSKTRAAEALGIPRRRLYRRIVVLKIDIPAIEASLARAARGRIDRG